MGEEEGVPAIGVKNEAHMNWVELLLRAQNEKPMRKTNAPYQHEAMWFRSERLTCPRREHLSVPSV
jgi:hypothetical protein